MSETPGKYTTKRDRRAATATHTHPKVTKPPTMPTTTSQDELERAVAQLGKSEKGRQTMRDLLAFLQNGGVSLDGSNQLAVLTLLRGAWTTSPGTVRDLLTEQIRPS